MSLKITQVSEYTSRNWSIRRSRHPPRGVKIELNPVEHKEAQGNRSRLGGTCQVKVEHDSG